MPPTQRKRRRGQPVAASHAPVPMAEQGTTQAATPVPEAHLLTTRANQATPNVQAIDYAELAKHILAQQKKDTTVGPIQSSNMSLTEKQSSTMSTEQSTTIPADVIGGLLNTVFGGGSPGSSFPGHQADSNTLTSLSYLNSTTATILRASLSESRRGSYKHSWVLYQNLHGTNISLPLPLQNICHFIAHLFDKQYSPSSIASHVSALSFLHKLLSISDPTQSFIVKKLLKGCHKLTTSHDQRLPITKEIISKLIVAMEHTVSQGLNRLLLKALFLLCFNEFLRLGEVVVKSASDVDKVIQLNHVTFQLNGVLPTSVQIVLHHHKTQKKHDPITIVIQSVSDCALCPVKSLFQYKCNFPHTSRPLFQFTNGTPVPYSYVCAQLSKASKFAGLDSKRYKGHSFRIGAATHAAQLGYSENYIQHLGRLNSNVLHRYIRIASFKL